jgi:hypothetical protein
MSDKAPKPQQVVVANATLNLATQAAVETVVPINLEWRITRCEPLPDGHPILALVGQAASEFARLEGILDETIWKLTNLAPYRGACVTSNLSGWKSKCSTIRSLHSQRNLPEATRRQIKKFEGALDDAAETRNRLIHDPWYLVEDEKTSQLRSMPRRTLEFGYVVVSPEDVKRDIAQIRVFIRRAEDLRDAILAELSSLK